MPLAEIGDDDQQKLFILNHLHKHLAKEVGKLAKILDGEPLREWIKSSSEAEIRAKSQNYHKLKQSIEKIGTNRRLLDKKVLVRGGPPFYLIPKKNGFLGASPAEGGASEQSSRSEKSLSFDWSGQRESNPPFHAPHACVLPIHYGPIVKTDC